MSKRNRIERCKAEFLMPEHVAGLKKHFLIYAALGAGDDASILEGVEDNINILLCNRAGVPSFVARHYLISPPSKVARELGFVSKLVGQGYPTVRPIATITGSLFLDRGK